jgi:predicted hotdog family 3-hydroxylacyl-ACP dehydratase
VNAKPIIDYLPHAGRMVLVDELIERFDDGVACRVRVRPDATFATEAGSVPAWVGIEYIAQTIAAFGGVAAADSGSQPPAGFLLGTRRLRSAVPFFSSGQSLRVEVHEVFSDGRLSSFAGTISDEANAGELVSATVNVMIMTSEEDA